MAEPGDWEFSKENIQPLRQGPPQCPQDLKQKMGYSTPMHLEARVGLNMAQQVREQKPPGEEEVRTSLAPLGTQGKHGVATIVRTGPVARPAEPRRGGLAMVSAGNRGHTKVREPSFQQEENAGILAQPATAAPLVVPAAQSAKKCVAPGEGAGAKAKQRLPVAPAQSKLSIPGVQPRLPRTPVGIPGSRRALRVRKEREPDRWETWTKPVVPHPPGLKTRAMYDKAVFYRGTTEFQFEELRMIVCGVPRTRRSFSPTDERAQTAESNQLDQVLQLLHQLQDEMQQLRRKLLELQALLAATRPPTNHSQPPLPRNEAEGPQYRVPFAELEPEPMPDEDAEYRGEEGEEGFQGVEPLEEDANFTYAPSKSFVRKVTLTPLTTGAPLVGEDFMVGGLTAMVQAVAIAGAPAATQGEQQLPGGPKPLRARQQPEVAPPPPASGAAPLEDPAMPASKRHFSVATAGDLRCQEEQEEEAADLEIDEEMVVEADREKEERRGGVSVDPFSDALQSHILSSWELLKSDQERLHLLSGNRPALNADAHITLGGQQLRVVRYLTAGLHARVYLAETVNTEETFLDDAPEESFQAPTKVVLKLDAHSNSGLWEFYVTTELARRLREAYSNKRAVNSIADLLYGCCYSNSSILVFPFSCYGTLLDLLSRYRRQGKELAVPECLVLYLALELITAVGQVHTCGVIHADIKPDDVLIYDLPSEAGFIDRFDEAGVNCIRLTDFGRAIDMTALPAGTVFTQVMQTDGLISTEMLEGQPWTFQLDWFGVLGCLHMLLFGKIMLVKQLEDGRWAPRLKFKRYWQQDLWTRLFSELLNIPSCAEQPDVTPFLLEIKNLLLERSRAHDVVMEALRAKRL